MIRDATADDIGEMVPLLERCFAEMRYEESGYKFNPDSVAKTTGLFIEQGHVCVVSIDDSGAINGIGIVAVVPSFMDESHVLATETVWHSEPGLNYIARGRVMIELLKSMEASVADRGIDHLHVSSAVAFESASLMLKRHGYRLVEHRYVKEI